MSETALVADAAVPRDTGREPEAVGGRLSCDSCARRTGSKSESRGSAGFVRRPVRAIASGMEMDTVDSAPRGAADDFFGGPGAGAAVRRRPCDSSSRTVVMIGAGLTKAKGEGE